MQAGAKHVYGIECSAIAEQAQQIVEDNGYSGKVRATPHHTTPHRPHACLCVLVCTCVCMRSAVGSMAPASMHAPCPALNCPELNLKHHHRRQPFIAQGARHPACCHGCGRGDKLTAETAHAFG